MSDKLNLFEMALLANGGGGGGSSVTVSASGTSTNDVRYITIDGSESRFTSVALRAMKNAWVTGTTASAATAILNDDSVVAGDGFLATVYWTDLPGEVTQAEVKAFVLKKGTGYQKIIQFECTSGTVAPYSWFYNSYEGVWRSQVPLNNTLTSTSVDEALSANMGKTLKDQIDSMALTTITNYDSTKTQVLKNVNGTFQWVDET